MSKRERILIWSVALLVGLFVLDRLVVSPLQAHLGQLKADADAVEQRIDDAMVLIDNRELIRARWAGCRLAGLDQDPAAARLVVQGRLSRFAQETGVALNNLSAGGNLDNAPFTEVRFSLTGTGELDAIARFLKRVQEASLPLAVLGCDISRRNDDSDRLTLRLTVSTLVLSEPEADS